MRTSEFIAALAADPVPEPIRLGRRVAVALVVGLAASVAIYVLMLGPRPDIAAACDTMRFWLKFVDSFAFALPTVLLTLRLARPDAKPRALALWLLAPFILLAAGVVVELLVVPRSEWMSRLMGATALHCTITIPMLAAPILVALIVALRPGAPLYPVLTGAMAGAAAAGVGALVYASSCPGDSPLFVATWYPLATLICMGVGALAGRRFLAWCFRINPRARGLIRSIRSLQVMELSSAETELKIALSPSVAETVFSLPVFTQRRSGRSKSQRLVTTYYETPAKDLARRGVTLRIRRANDKRIQTVKSVGDSGVANSRGEWEWPVESATPDLRLLKDAPIANLFADVSEDQLEPVVVTDVVRTTQSLKVNGDLVEAALDLGSIIAGKTRQEIL